MSITPEDIQRIAQLARLHFEKSEIETIEGFDESTAEELQARAHECIEEIKFQLI